MNQEQWTAVDGYIAGHLVPKDAALEGALQASEKGGLPAISVSPTEGKLLMLMAKMCRARKILEIGTLGGYSTIWLARGMGKGGRLITLELEEKHAKVARENLKRAGFGRVAEVRVGKAARTLAQLHKEKGGPFDLIFLDAHKESYPTYLRWALKLSRKGTVIVADNVVRKGKVLDEKSDDASVRGVRAFMKMLTKEKRIHATAIQTVGVKGWDGMAIGMVV